MTEAELAVCKDPSLMLKVIEQYQHTSHSESVIVFYPLDLPLFASLQSPQLPG
jgi:hypothetical protein